MTQDNQNPGIIDVDMFSKDVDSASHPEAEKFRLLLEQVADDNQCSLLSFDVSAGTVSFSFDSEELTSKILKILQDTIPS